ncbi:MAG: hypothetical protein PHE54_04665, partial [Bacilli bacterium]|nr:hypothetical protein [Bacilli bacterium]
FDLEIINGSDFDKYLDKYDYGATYNDEAAYNRAIMGDATTETKGWYNDSKSSFVYAAYSWFMRGGGYTNSTNAGIMCFNSNWGTSSASHNITSRAVYVNL